MQICRWPALVLLCALSVGAAGAQRATGKSPARAVSAGAAKAMPSMPAQRAATDVTAGGAFDVCFNYGCFTERTVDVSGQTLDAIRRELAAAPDAPAERETLARAVGMLLAEAGRQTPVAADRAGNYLDQEVEGRMDCIDHSTSTTRVLRMLEARGWLRFHRVLEPERRVRFILQHFGAVVEEHAAADDDLLRAASQRKAASPRVPDHVPNMLALCDCAEVLGDVATGDDARGSTAESAPGERFVIDSWFVNNGEPAVVLPLAEWLDGGGPNVQ